MSQHNNPNAISTGLAFAYDQANPKSYKGPAVKNFLTQIEPRGISDNGTTYRFFSGTEQVYIPEVGTLTSAYVDMYNDYNGGSNNCCPSPYGYGQGLTVTGNTQYTYAILYKSYNRYTNPNWMYHYEYGPNGYITEYGVHMVGGYSGQETHLGDGWYWSRAIFTTNPNCNTLYTGSWMYQYATWNRFYVAKVALLEGNWLDLHPKYWPTLGTTRSNTQAILDITNNYTITANSLNYNNDNTFNFNGSNSNLDAPPPNVGNFSIDIVAKWTSSLSDVFACGTEPMGSGISGGTYIKTHIQSNGMFTDLYSPQVLGGGWKSGNVVSGSFTTNTTYNITIVNSGTIWYYYSNGVYLGSYDHTYLANTGSSRTGIFRNHVQIVGNAGYVYAYKQYNRALSSQEVQQNFAAQRGRYGI